MEKQKTQSNVLPWAIAGMCMILSGVVIVGFTLSREHEVYEAKQEVLGLLWDHYGDEYARLSDSVAVHLLKFKKLGDTEHLKFTSYRVSAKFCLRVKGDVLRMQADLYNARYGLPVENLTQNLPQPIPRRN